MKELYMPVVWVGMVSGRFCILKPYDQSQGLAQVIFSDGRYWSSIGERLADGHKTLEAAQKAVEKHFKAKHIN